MQGMILTQPGHLHLRGRTGDHMLLLDRCTMLLVLLIMFLLLILLVRPSIWIMMMMRMIASMAIWMDFGRTLFILGTMELTASGRRRVWDAHGRVTWPLWRHGT